MTGSGDEGGIGRKLSFHVLLGIPKYESLLISTTNYPLRDYGAWWVSMHPNCSKFNTVKKFLELISWISWASATFYQNINISYDSNLFRDMGSLSK